MGFQTGSQIRPELSRPDLSGFHQAAQMNANTFAQLGASISGAIQSHKKKKEEKELFDASKLAISGIASENQEVAKGLGLLDNTGGVDEEAVGVMVKTLGGGAPAMQVISQFMQQEAENKRIDSATAFSQGIAERDMKVKERTTSKPASMQKGEIYELKDGSQIPTYFDSRTGQRYMQGTNDPLPSSATKVSTPSTVINTGDGESGEYTKRIERTHADMREGYRPALEKAAKARKALELLDNGVDTGFGEDWKLQAKRFGNAIGLDYDISDAETFEAFAKPMVMDFISQTKGAISDKEMAKFESWSAGLNKTEEANKAILQSLIKAQDNVAATARIVNDGYGEGKTAVQIERDIQEYLEANPIFGEINAKKSASSKVQNATPKAPPTIDQQEKELFDKIDSLNINNF